MIKENKNLNDINPSIIEIQGNFVYLQNENNHNPEEGKKLLEAASEANFLFLDILSLKHMEEWFNKYQLLKENMEQYAPNMASFAIKKFLKETPFSFLPEMDDTSKTAIDGIIDLSQKLLNLEQKFSEIIRNDTQLIDYIKEKVFENFYEMNHSSNMGYGFSRWAIPSLIRRTNNEFYKEIMDFDIIEIAKTDKQLNYNCLMTLQYWEAKGSNHIEKYGYEPEVYAKLNELERKNPQEYFETLNEKQKSKEFKKHFEQFKYSSLNESQMLLDFVINYNYCVNQTERKMIKTRFDYDSTVDQTYWDKFDFACAKAKIGHKISSLNKEHDGENTTEQFKI